MLVVEDHPPLRDLLASTLRDCGYEVVEADGCAGLLAAALPAAADRGRPIRLVVTDTVLPDGSGIDAVERVRERGWTGPVIFVAPFAAEARRRARCVRDALVLAPPFDTGQLRAWAAARMPAPGPGRDGPDG